MGQHDKLKEIGVDNRENGFEGLMSVNGDIFLNL
jgi:hypothetical protein